MASQDRGAVGATVVRVRAPVSRLLGRGAPPPASAEPDVTMVRPRCMIRGRTQPLLVPRGTTAYYLDLFSPATYEALSKSDRSVFIGESLALLGEFRRLAYEEHDRLSSDKAASGVLGTEARLECLRVIVAAQKEAHRVLSW